MNSPASLPRLVALSALCFFTTIGDAVRPCRGAIDVPADGSHLLFMGTDISIEWRNEFYPLRAVRDDSFVIRVREQDVMVPMKREGVKIRVSQSLRLTRATAAVNEFTSARAYTPARDPMRRMNQNASVAMALADASDDADRTARDAVIQAEGANVVASGPMGASPDLQQRVDATAAAAQQMEIMSLSNAGDLGAQVANAQAERARELFDALEISCDISASRPLRDPFLVIIAQYQEPGTPPDKLRRWIHGETLKNISERPARIRIKQGGFPPGFQLHDVRMHVYEQGQEVATNLSRRSVTFTAEETFKYLFIEYTTENRDATLPARPVPELWPADAISALSVDQASRVYYVAVDKDGLPRGSFVDAECTTPTDKLVADLVERVRFYPALRDGEPTDSVTSVRPGRNP